MVGYDGQAELKIERGFRFVKTQQTKNAVIIPVGSKGGFVIKEQPVTNDSGVTPYKRFITAMLQLTDNLLHQKKHS